MIRSVSRILSRRRLVHLSLATFLVAALRAAIAPRSPETWIVAGILAVLGIGLGALALRPPSAASRDDHHDDPHRVDHRMVGRQAIKAPIVEPARPEVQIGIQLQKPPMPRQISPIPPAPSRYPLLRPEDEAEIEYLFQRLKASRLDVRSGDSRESSES